MRKFLFFLLLPLAALAAACNQTPRAMAPKSAFQQSAEDLSVAYDLAAKKQLLVNNQERHTAEMAKQEAELQLRAQRASELSQAVERLATEQKALGEEIRRRTPPPPPPTRSAAMDLPAESAPMQVVEQWQAPAPAPQQRVQVVQYYMPRIVADALAAEERQRQQASHRGRGGWQVARNTAGWAAVGAGGGAAIGAIRDGRSGAISSTWKGALIGAGAGLLREAFRR